MIILMVRMIILMGQDDGFPTPPHPTPNGVFGNLLGVPSYWAFPWPGGGGGGGARPWPSGAGGKESGAWSSPPGPGLAPVQVRATFFAPSATWPWPGATAARPRERPVIWNAQ